MKKIAICDFIHPKGIELLKKEKDIDVIEAMNIPKGKELYEFIKDADVIITRSPTPVNLELLNYLKNLKAIIRAGVGVDNIDINECSKRGIIVMNVPTANTIAAVELTMAHMLNCVRAFPYAHNQLKNDRIWKRENWLGVELCGKKLGIIGFGNIGSRVGVRAKAFGMEVITYDPYIPPEKATELGVVYTENFDDILKCDIITIHTPKNKETINMISFKEIEKMKDGVVLINCARGGLYNEKALYEGLKSKKIRFAGIDVFEKEPTTDNKLFELDNVTVTPHLGANTIESQEKIALGAVEQALEAARGISYPNALNLPIKENEIPPFVRPFLELAQKLGNLAGQVNKGVYKSIKLIAQGEIDKYVDSLITFATVGVLKESLGDSVNYVNAAFVAKERGIELKAISEPNNSGYKNKLIVRVTTEKDVVEIGGTIFEERVQRIVEINGFILDVEPRGKMILFKNTDVPGVIGQVGMILAKHNINIADFRLGRDSHSLALAVIIIDDEIREEVLKELFDLEACIWVSYAIL